MERALTSRSTPAGMRLTLSTRCLQNTSLVYWGRIQISLCPTRQGCSAVLHLLKGGLPRTSLGSFGAARLVLYQCRGSQRSIPTDLVRQSTEWIWNEAYSPSCTLANISPNCPLWYIFLPRLYLPNVGRQQKVC